MKPGRTSVIVKTEDRIPPMPRKPGAAMNEAGAWVHRPAF